MLLKTRTHGPVLVDDTGLPRFWPTAWLLLHGAQLAPSTQRKKLGHIEALYRHTEALGGNLDDAIAELDLDRLGNALESFFVALRNLPEPTTTAAFRWDTAFRFVRDICFRLEKSQAVGKKLDAIDQRMRRLDNLYLGLRPYRPRKWKKPRAIPAHVVRELLAAAHPGAPHNPFSSEATQWRVFVLVNLLLIHGLRRGEALSLPADFLKSEQDPRTGVTRWWLSVRTNDEKDDPRAEAPSVKTINSVRTIPVEPFSASAFLTYLENYRGKVSHRYFLSSARGTPLTLEGAYKALERLTAALSPKARDDLLDATGAKHITPHALRHTCAGVRVRQLFEKGETADQVMQSLRAYFGWSKNSLMPVHYTRPALAERMAATMDAQFGERLDFLRGLPE